MNILRFNNSFSNKIRYVKMKRNFHIKKCLMCKDLNQFFVSKYDKYGGLHYDTSGTNYKSIKSFGLERFNELLKKNIQARQDSQIRTLWFRITYDNVFLIEPLVKLGFNFHHTKDNHVFMVKSLSGKGNIPKYAYTNVGVGGLVVNHQNQILIVKEKVKLTNFWKFPGGYVEQDEELSDAAVREVFEETGIKTDFRCILTMRHLHKVPWGFDCSDLYFVCLLHPKTSVEEVSKCPDEIDLCKWVNINNVEEYLSIFNNLVIRKYLEWKTSNVEIGYDVLKTNFPFNSYNVFSIKKRNDFDF